jgi:hypothetical protein
VPRKVFVSGEILTAAAVNENLMDQSVMVFDSSAARGSAIPTPSEGMVTYLKDTDGLEKYTTAWEPVNTFGVVQVVSTTLTSTFSASVASGGTAAITGLSASITPTSASNKVLVSVSANGSYSSVSYLNLIVKADGTGIFVGNAAGSRTPITGGNSGSDVAIMTTVSHTGLHAPATTSAVTYSVDFHNQAPSTTTLYINRASTDTDNARNTRGASSITLMEVAV